MECSQSGKRGSRGVLVLAGSAAFLLSAPVLHAQDNDATTLEKVIVTGSAIARTEKEGAAPVQTITRKDIERSGLTTVADVVRSISSDNSGTLASSFEGAFAGAAAGVALRGLTVNSTLVLVDGRRVANYALDDDGERGFVDLNSIPLVAVERIEVLKDGGSSLYGADAIAGVVNIILQKEFVGKDISAEYGSTQHGGGEHTRVTGEFGTGRLSQNGYNAYFTVEYERDASIKAYQRGFPYNTNDLSSIGGINQQVNQPFSGLNPGSYNGTVEAGTLLPGTSPSPLNVVPVTSGPGSVPQLLNVLPGSNPCYSGSSLAYINGDTSGASGDFCQYNPVSFSDIQPEVDRFGLHGKFEVKLNDNASVYLKATFYDTKTRQAGNLGTGASQINNNSGGSPLTTNIALPPTIPGPNGTTIANPNDPFAASGEWAVIQYQFGDIPSSNVLENQNYRIVGGIKGSFDAFGEWDYDSALTINKTNLTENAYGDLLTNQLLADVTNGTYNFLHSLGPNSASVLSALAPEDSITNTTELDMIDFRVNRELVNLPGGALGLAMGAEYRHEDQNAPNLDPTETGPAGTTYNQYISTFDLHTAQVFGQHDITAFYTELDAPVLRTLDIDGAFRYDHYTDVADHGITPKIGIKWTPIKQAALRGTYSEGFRAPSFAESGANSSNLGYVTASAVSEIGSSACTGFIGAHCIGGQPDSYVTSNYNQGGLSVGNPHLSPEKARNFTLGVVLQPIQAVSVSADWYHIKKTNLINPYATGPIFGGYFANITGPGGYTPPPGVTLQTGAPDPQAPNAPALPILVSAPYINANDETTQGFDVDLQAHFKLYPGVRFTSELNYTEIMSFRLDQPGLPSNQYAGTQGPYILSSGAGTPRDRFSWVNTVEYGPLTVTATLNWVDGYHEWADDIDNPATCLYNGATGNPIPAGCKIAPFNEIDVVGNYKIMRNLDVSLNIQNLLDSKAPLDPADYAAFNYNSTYTQKGVVGRMFIGGVHYRF